MMVAAPQYQCLADRLTASPFLLPIAFKLENWEHMLNSIKDPSPFWGQVGSAPARRRLSTVPRNQGRRTAQRPRPVCGIMPGRLEDSLINLTEA